MDIDPCRKFSRDEPSNGHDILSAVEREEWDEIKGVEMGEGK